MRTKTKRWVASRDRECLGSWESKRHDGMSYRACLETLECEQSDKLHDFLWFASLEQPEQPEQPKQEVIDWRRQRVKEADNLWLFIYCHGGEMTTERMADSRKAMSPRGFEKAGIIDELTVMLEETDQWGV
jgi:hypothetical protein